MSAITDNLNSSLNAEIPSKTILLDTFDNKKLNVHVWDNCLNKPRFAVVISHGMAEHAQRYDDFARFLNSNDIVVIADDHRAHKNSPDGLKGITSGDCFSQTVDDMKLLVNYAKEHYSPDVYLLGHSYGSFLSQCFLELYSSELKGCILSGTAYMKVPLIKLAKVIANVQTAVFGRNKTGHLINKLSFGSYNKPFESQKQKFAWLSRDKDSVALYESDEYCGFPMSLGFYKSFFNSFSKMYDKRSISINKEFPILIAVGSNDPVSNNSALAKRLFDFYKTIGLTNVELKIYDGARHEILNELNRTEVYHDFLSFLSATQGGLVK
ncbi:MAG: alpha/beta hydrolase [Christensenellaceae bacterium]|jgi:alpha-beta hydrolase superfamily lysophospholipase|nr:alpha/beta hydrolase [Christensenellaceae bacterium]